MSKIKNLTILGKHAWPAALLFLLFLFPLLPQSPGDAAVNPQVLGAKSPLAARGLAVPSEPEPVPVKKGEPDLSLLSADSLMAYDEKTGTVLAQRNPAQTLGIASLTKLLTALVVYERLDMNSYLTIAQGDLLDVSPALHLRVGDRVKIGDLFSAMLVGSCNDAALALANHTASVSNTEFEELMNQKALELGMSASHFSNPMGFDSAGNFSTAEDVKRLVDETRKYGIFALEGKRKEYSFTSADGRNYRTTATSRLINSDPEITGIKTGYTNQTGGSMVSRAVRGNRPIILIILNSRDREGDTSLLKEQVFQNFVWEKPAVF